MHEIHLPEQPGTQTLSLAELADILDIALAGGDAKLGDQSDKPRRVASAIVDIARSALGETGSNRQRVINRSTPAT